MSFRGATGWTALVRYPSAYARKFHLAASHSGIRARATAGRRSGTDPRPGGSVLCFPSLGLAHHAVFQLSELHVAHVKVTTSPRGIRELYCRLVGYGDQAVVEPPGHDRGALGATRVGLNDEMPALLGVLDIALGSRHRLFRPFSAEARFVCRYGRQSPTACLLTGPLRRSTCN
jgi:hypothetical protein